MSPVEVQEVNFMFAEGMSTGFKLSPEGAVGLAKALRKAARFRAPERPAHRWERAVSAVVHA